MGQTLSGLVQVQTFHSDHHFQYEVEAGEARASARRISVTDSHHG